MKNFKTPILSALVFFGTLLVLSVGYAAWTSLVLSDADGGKPLTSTLMKGIIGDIIELKTSVDGLNATISGLVPTGTVIAYNGTSCPNGWLEASGSNVPAGVGGSTTLNLRGEFIRGLDNGRGIDTGRTLASWQKGTFNTMNVGGDLAYPLGYHWYSSNTLDADHDSARNMFGMDSGDFNLYSNANSYITWPPASGVSGLVSVKGNMRNGDGQKDFGYGSTRPRNVALLYCVKQ